MKIEIKTADAVAALEKNLAEHIEELKEASAGWTSQVIAALEEFRDAVDRQGIRAAGDKLYRLIYSRPQDSRKEYSRYLSSLKRAVNGTVEVDEEDCDRIFNDNWDWRVQSKTSNASYTRPK